MKHSMAFKIRQICFRPGPSTDPAGQGSSRCSPLPRFFSRLGRGHPCPYLSHSAPRLGGAIGEALPQLPPPQSRRRVGWGMGRDVLFPAADLRPRRHTLQLPEHHTRLLDSNFFVKHCYYIVHRKTLRFLYIECYCSYCAESTIFVFYYLLYISHFDFMYNPAHVSV